MTADQYLQVILTREAVPTGLGSPLYKVQNELAPKITAWANGRLLEMHASGSYMKGTSNRSGTDVDLFISLSPETTESLSEIHTKLFARLVECGYSPKKQNVSINITVQGESVDLVPGKLQNYLTADHSLYRRRASTWTKTNVQTHILHVGGSNLLPEIRILKLWRDQMGLDFPSFYLELTVMAALATSRTLSVSANVWIALQYLQDKFVNARVVDPANTNNIISEDLTLVEKQSIQSKARTALAAKTWEEIVR